jgi:hypothetical protein
VKTAFRNGSKAILTFNATVEKRLATSDAMGVLEKMITVNMLPDGSTPPNPKTDLTP